MKIVQANKAYFPHLGGVETVVRQLAEGFAERGHTSSVVACADSNRTLHEQMNGVNVTRTASLGRVASLALSPSFSRHLFARAADIVQLHEPSLVPAAAYLAASIGRRRTLGKPIVWWHSEIVRQRLLRPAYGPLLRRLLSEASMIVISSPHLLTTSALLAPFAHKCRVVHLGVEPERFRASAESDRRVSKIRAQYGGKPIVLFTGRLVYYKGVDVLVRAARRVPEAQFVIVGRGKLRPLVDRLCSESVGNVDVIDYLDADDLAAMYRACAVFTLPSVEKTEAFGIVQLEAMACGVPVVTSDLETGVTYVNQDGRTGFVVPRRDEEALAGAIRRLLADPELRSRLGEFARQRVLSEFTVSGMVDRTIAVYREAMADSTAGVLVG